MFGVNVLQFDKNLGRQMDRVESNHRESAPPYKTKKTNWAVYFNQGKINAVLLE